MKKTILIVISLAMILAFAGCQLAEEGKGTAANADALCGMYITFDYINNNEDFSDNVDWNAVMNGDQPSLYSQEAGKIYAVPADNGRTKDFVFKDIEGLRLFGVFVPGNEDSEGYNATCRDDVLLDSQTAYNVTDSGTEMTMEATLYVCPKVYYNSLEFVCFCNPVYQTPDGQVYMTAGSGLGADMYTGNSITQTLSGTAEKTENGKKESRKATVKLTVTAIDYIEKYVLKEYDGEDRVVSPLEITKDSVPKEITFNKDTAYAILEKHCVNAEGKRYVERSVMDMNSEYMEIRFINEKGFARAYGITLKNLPGKST